MHKLTLRQIKNGLVLQLDGKPLVGVQNLVIRSTAKLGADVTTATITFEIEPDIDVEADKQVKPISVPWGGVNIPAMPLPAYPQPAPIMYSSESELSQMMKKLGAIGIQQPVVTTTTETQDKPPAVIDDEKDATVLMRTHTVKDGDNRTAHWPIDLPPDRRAMNRAVHMEMGSAVGDTSGLARVDFN